jgi:hypothetical protein
MPRKTKKKEPINPRSEAARKGWETRRKNQRSEAAKKGWETRRKNEEKKQAAVKKGVETRRRNKAAAAGTVRVSSTSEWEYAITLAIQQREEMKRTEIVTNGDSGKNKTKGK